MLEARVPPHPLPHSSTNPTVPTSPFFRKKKERHQNAGTIGQNK